MDTKELVERLNDLIDYLGVPSVHEDEIATVGTAIATIERLERERDEARAKGEATARLALSLEVEADERIAVAESELTTLRARVAKMEEALKRISRSHDCGCVPCVGQCRSQESLEIANEGMRETARDALTEEPKP